ncbi:MAG: TonB family protein, partial [Acidobacteriota bacterium]
PKSSAGEDPSTSKERSAAVSGPAASTPALPEPRTGTVAEGVEPADLALASSGRVADIQGPGGGRRKEGRQWLVTFLVLVMLGVAFVGAMQWISRDWWPDDPAASPDGVLASGVQSSEAPIAAAPESPTPSAGSGEPPVAAAPPAATPEGDVDGPVPPRGSEATERVDAPPASATASSDAPGTSSASAADSPPASAATGVPGADSEGSAELGAEAGSSSPPPASAVEPDRAADDNPLDAVPVGPSADAVAATDEPVAVESVRARKVFAPQPGYPEGARNRGEQGTVTVRGVITAQGDVRDASVVSGASPSLDRAALEAFRTWQFLPAKRDGQPVASSYRVAFNFQFDPSDLVERPSTPPVLFPAPPAAEGAEPAPPESAPLPFGGEFTPPARWVTPLPVYPQSARASGAEGDVVLTLVVDADGSVESVDVTRGLSPALDAAALEAVRRWRFRPATQDGVPVRVEHRVTLRFAP